MSVTLSFDACNFPIQSFQSISWSCHLFGMLLIYGIYERKKCFIIIILLFQESIISFSFFHSPSNSVCLYFSFTLSLASSSDKNLVHLHLCTEDGAHWVTLTEFVCSYLFLHHASNIYILNSTFYFYRIRPDVFEALQNTN